MMIEEPETAPGTASNANPGLSPRTSQFDDEVEFRRIRMLFVRRWKTVAAAIIVGTAAAFAITSVQPQQYEAVVPLVLSGPPAAVGSSNASNVRMLLTAPALLQEVAASTGDEGGVRAIDVDAVFVDPVPQTAFVRLRVRMDDPTRTARVAQMLAVRGAELSRKVRTEPLEAAPEANDARVDGARAALDRAESNLLEFRRQSQIEILRRDIESRLDQRATAQSIEWEIERERARLAAALEEVERYTGRMKAGEGAEGSTEPEVVSASVLLEAFARTAAESRIRLAELEQTRRQLAGTIKGDPQRLDDLYRNELQLKRLEQEYELARQVYETEAERARREGGSISVPMIKLVEESVPAAHPVPRERLRLIGLAMVLSFLFGLALVILLELFGAGRRSSEEASRS